MPYQNNIFQTGSKTTQRDPGKLKKINHGGHGVHGEEGNNGMRR
jgi:hypothetical protein